MQIESKTTDDMMAKWAELSAKFKALNAARPQLLQLRCASCAPSRTVNGAGPHIKAHFGPVQGWRSVSGPYPCPCAAKRVMAMLREPGCELMVYEALAGEA